MKRSTSDWAALLLGLVLGIIVLKYAHENLVVKPEAVAFGTDTTGHLGGVGATTMHCMDSTDSLTCMDSYHKSGLNSAILWLGNSQLPGINRYSKGEHNAPQILHKALVERGYFLMTYSQPNANLLEHALVLDAVVPQIDVKLVVLPVVFDDIREHGIRKNIADFILDPIVSNNIKASPVSTFYGGLVSLEPNSVSGEKIGKTKQILQKRVECYLDSWLGSHSTLWAARPAIRGTLVSAIHNLRNKVLGIHSYTKRSVDHVVYSERMELLEAMLINLKSKKIDILLYVPPYRDDIEGPYIISQYSEFKKDLQQLSEHLEIHFVNLEGIVPGLEWGTVTERIFGFKEPDFMHFTAAGHEKLATELNKKIRSMGF